MFVCPAVTDRTPYGDDVSTMRTTLSILTLCASLTACDVPKSVGDEDSSTSGADSSSPQPQSTSTTSPDSATSTTADPSNPTSASGTTVATSGAAACPVFDAGPVADPDSSYSWECMCQTCDLSFPDIPLETVEQFEVSGLCQCLCAEAGCGFVQGEAGVGGGAETATSGWPDTEGGSATTGWSETDTFGEATAGAAALTVGACLDEGGEVVGDPGDGSVFEPDYVCPSGASPLGILDFEPGMPFPKNGGVCCL